MSKKSLDAGYFDDLYANNPDPWDFQSSDYEAAKYTATVAALDGRRYRFALEVGCSIGVLTSSLAKVADQLTATDVSNQALRLAQDRNAHEAHVRFERLALPAIPKGAFDLIVLSEVLYYLDEQDLADAAEAVCAQLMPGGDALLVHWLGETDYPLTGDQAAEGFMRRAGSRLTTVRQMRHPQYRLDRLRRAT